MYLKVLLFNSFFFFLENIDKKTYKQINPEARIQVSSLYHKPLKFMFSHLFVCVPPWHDVECNLSTRFSVCGMLQASALVQKYVVRSSHRDLHDLKEGLYHPCFVSLIGYCWGNGLCLIYLLDFSKFQSLSRMLIKPLTIKLCFEISTMTISICSKIFKQIELYKIISYYFSAWRKNWEALVSSFYFWNTKELSSFFEVFLKYVSKNQFWFICRISL